MEYANTAKERLTVLVIDDEPRILQIVSAKLNKKYQVFTASNYETAIEAFNSNPIDICLSDLKMPGKCGLELAQKLKDLDPCLPIVLMTGHGDKESTIAGIRTGVFDWIDKPFQLKNLEQIMDRAEEHLKAIKQKVATENRRIAKALVVSYNHEIRNPLAVALGHVEISKEQIEPRRFLRIVSSLKRIVKLLEEFEETCEHILRLSSRNGQTEMLVRNKICRQEGDDP